MLPGHEINVVVPVELGDSGFFHLPEEALLHLLQQVETNEDIVLEMEIGKLMLRDITVEHAFVGQSVFAQTVAESMVERFEVLPDVVELLLQDGVGLHLAEEVL